MSDIDIQQLRKQAAEGDEIASEQLYRVLRRAGIIPSWDELRKHLWRLTCIEGPSKSSSGTITISIDGSEGTLHVDVGTYDLASLPRWSNLGPFKSMKEARKAVAYLLDQAETAMEREAAEDRALNSCPACGASIRGDDSLQAWERAYCAKCNHNNVRCKRCDKPFVTLDEAQACQSRECVWT